MNGGRDCGVFNIGGGYCDVAAIYNPIFVPSASGDVVSVACSPILFPVGERWVSLPAHDSKKKKILSSMMMNGCGCNPALSARGKKLLKSVGNRNKD